MQLLVLQKADEQPTYNRLLLPTMPDQAHRNSGALSCCVVLQHAEQVAIASNPAYSSQQTVPGSRRSTPTVHPEDGARYHSQRVGPAATLPVADSPAH